MRTEHGGVEGTSGQGWGGRRLKAGQGQAGAREAAWSLLLHVPFRRLCGSAICQALVQGAGDPNP